MSRTIHGYLEEWEEELHQTVPLGEEQTESTQTSGARENLCPIRQKERKKITSWEAKTMRHNPSTSSRLVPSIPLLLLEVSLLERVWFCLLKTTR